MDGRARLHGVVVTGVVLYRSVSYGATAFGGGEGPRGGDKVGTVSYLCDCTTKRAHTHTLEHGNMGATTNTHCSSSVPRAVGCQRSGHSGMTSCHACCCLAGCSLNE